MTYYGEDLSRLTRAVAQLLHEGATGAAPLADPEPTLAARDAVVAVIRTSYNVITGISDDVARGIRISADTVEHPRACDGGGATHPRTRRRWGRSPPRRRADDRTGVGSCGRSGRSD